MSESQHRPPVAGRRGSRYLSVKDYVRGRIERGTWQSGHKIPSENELTRQFSVSRMTVNRALRELAEEGFLRRVQGAGTFVAEPTAQLSFLEIRNIADEINARGHIHNAQVFFARKEVSDKALAERMEINGGDPVFHSALVHFENGTPVQFEDRYVNPRMAADYLTVDFTTTTPSEYLLRTVPVSEIEHDIQSMLPDAETAKLLHIRQSAPCLVVNRRTWANGTVVTVARLIHPGDRYRVGGRFKRGDPIR